MGHPWRFEQLCRATGTVRIGDEEHRIDGGGNRIRRQGIRKVAQLWGHAWQAATFPSGRGFAYITYPPRKDGKPTLNEGHVFLGDGELVPARVVDPPWLRSLAPSGQDVSFGLETEQGTFEIRGETCCRPSWSCRRRSSAASSCSRRSSATRGTARRRRGCSSARSPRRRSSDRRCSELGREEPADGEERLSDIEQVAGVDPQGR